MAWSTLSGTAKNAAEMDLATKFVKDVHGVKSRGQQHDHRKERSCNQVTESLFAG